MSRSLKPYQKKRDFTKSPEPKGGGKGSKEPIFVVQRHNARTLHYDFRLEINGVLKSWAVPKGVPKKVGEKRLAVLTENHPLAYANFEGRIPEGEYGAGTVKISEKGVFENMKSKKMSTCFREGRIEVWLKGRKFDAPFALVHFKEKNWLLIRLRKK